jgi:hypothetical protein|tara:strand:+ start:1891 stop:2298 length:408 start_codon:yes stop_codon:yes gene_type:complete
MKEKKIARGIFIAILAIQAIAEFGLGGYILIDLRGALDSAFGITYTRNFDTIGLALGLYLLLLTGLMILSIVWTIQRKFSGITLGVIIGAFLVVFGLASYFKTGETGGLLGDGIRGVITIILGYMSYKELKRYQS